VSIWLTSNNACLISFITKWDVIQKKFLSLRFWCNRTDSCDNDGNITEMACQPRKTIYNYCENTGECLQRLGLQCYADRNQCDCVDLDR